MGAARWLRPTSAAPISGGTDVCDTVRWSSPTPSPAYTKTHVTPPYTDESWKIYRRRASVRWQLAAADVRLTVGGEHVRVGG